MKIVKAVLFVVMGAISLIANLSVPCRAYSATLADENISQSKSFVLDVAGNNLTYASAVALYDNGTPAAATFTDGRVATGSIVIGSLSGLTTAYASDTITVGVTTTLTGASIAFPGVTLRQGVDWSIKSSLALTAESIKVAINAKVSWLTATRTDNAITVTAKSPGSFYNTMGISSKNAGIVVASALMTGGADNAVVTIHGVKLIRGTHWFVGANTTDAATSLAAAITANSTLSALITAVPTTNSIALTSKASGLSKNLALNSSYPASLTMSGTAMTGGLDSGIAKGSANIAIVNHGFNAGLPVLFTKDTLNVDPLIDQVTYYTIVTDANNIELASTAANALAGTAIELSTRGTTGHAHTLTPLPAASATASFKWQMSEDLSTWSDMTVDEVTVSDFALLPLTKTWDLDTSDHYVRLLVTAPATGALNLNVTVSGQPLSEFVRVAGDTITGKINFANAPIVMTGTGGTITTAAGITAATVNTGQGANELYDMNQNVQTTDAVTFASINTGQGVGELFLMDQNVRRSDSPSFAGAQFTGPAALASASLTALAGTTPTYIGQVWSCYDCVPPKIAFATGTLMGQIGNALGALLE